MPVVQESPGLYVYICVCVCECVCVCVLIHMICVTFLLPAPLIT